MVLHIMRAVMALTFCRHFDCRSNEEIESTLVRGYCRTILQAASWVSFTCLIEKFDEPEGQEKHRAFPKVSK